jgi:hypothetical protein
VTYRSNQQHVRRFCCDFMVIRVTVSYLPQTTGPCERADKCFSIGFEADKGTCAVFCRSVPFMCESAKTFCAVRIQSTIVPDGDREHIAMIWSIKKGGGGGGEVYSQRQQHTRVRVPLNTHVNFTCPWVWTPQRSDRPFLRPVSHTDVKREHFHDRKGKCVESSTLCVYVTCNFGRIHPFSVCAPYPLHAHFIVCFHWSHCHRI